MSLITLVLGFGMLIFMGLLQAFILFGGSRLSGIVLGSFAIAPVLISAAAVVGMMRLGKDRIAVSRPGEDSKWKAGGLYWNSDDASIFVEKRAGIGYTLNMAHPVSWLIIILILAIAIIPILIIN